jgi:hypothetical protein
MRAEGRHSPAKMSSQESRRRSGNSGNGIAASACERVTSSCRLPDGGAVHLGFPPDAHRALEAVKQNGRTRHQFTIEIKGKLQSQPGVHKPGQPIEREETVGAGDDPAVKIGADEARAEAPVVPSSRTSWVGGPSCQTRAGNPVAIDTEDIGGVVRNPSLQVGGESAYLEVGDEFV